jgi:uncharacterized protein (DUF488 family)
MSNELFSIGHSTHSLDEFLSLLAMHSIKVLADIRRFPGSKRYPQFNRGSLASVLPNAGIEYHWMESLGGRRNKGTSNSINLGLRNESFRNHADYMMTEEFKRSIKELIVIAAGKPTAIMCSESVFWRCHRRLASDYLHTQGIAVQHIMPTGKLQPHSQTERATVKGGELIYPLPSTGELLFD